MSAEKCLLLLAEPSSPLASVGQELLGDEYRISLTATPEEAISFVCSRTKLSLVVVDGGNPHVSPETLAQLRAHAADLPVVWILPEDGEEPDFGMMETNALLPGPVGKDELLETIAPLIPEDLYPPSLTLTLVSGSNAVMATTFQASVDVGHPWYKLNSILPSGHTALLPFMGDNAAGHVLVSGTQEHLLALGLDLGFEESEGAGTLVREVLGEIANQIVGRIKNDCGSYLTDLRVGLPLIFAGSGLTISYPAGKPSVCVEVSDGRGTLHVEFSFQRAHVKVDNSEIYATGDVMLF